MHDIYDLLPAQRALFEVPHDCPTDVALYQGGVGSGKTTAGVLLGYLLSRLYPKSRGLVGARTYSLLFDTTRARWRELVPAKDIARWNQHPDNLVLKNGSEIWFRHLSSPERLASMEFNWVHIEEGSQIAAPVFYAILARLRHGGFETLYPDLPRRYRVFITSNPEEQAGFWHETFEAPETPRENFRFIRAPTRENRFLLDHKPDYIDTLLGAVDADYARIYLDGETGRMLKRAVYRNFDRDRDVSDGVAYSPALPLHLSFDFNVDFMYALVIQEQPDDVTAVVDEIVLRGGSSTDALCESVLRAYGNHAAGLHIHGDASGYARHHRSTRSDYAIIRERLGHLPGFRMRVRRGSANPNVRERSNAVNFRIENARGERRLRLAPRCRFLIRSLEQTRFLEDRFEKEKVRDASDPRFVVDHPGDALDYYMADEHPFQRERLSVVPYV